MGEGTREDWFDESEVRSQVPVPPSIPLQGEKRPQSSLADDPMTRLWQGQTADGRETGTEAVEAIRARRRSLRGRPEGKAGWWHRIRHGHLH